MKLSALLCASLLALGTLALTADGAFAATTIKSSKSNTSDKLDPNDPNAAKACTDKGGVVSTDKDGNRFCTLPATVTSPASERIGGVQPNPPPPPVH